MNFFDFAWYFFAFTLLLSLISFIFYRISVLHRNFFVFFFILFLSFSFGICRVVIDNGMSLSYQVYQDSVGKELIFEGVVVEEPDLRDKTTNLIVELSNEKGHLFLLRTNPYKEFNYGDKLSVKGILERPEPFETDGRIFDYDKFLAKDKIYYLMNFPNIKVLSSRNGNMVKASILSLKKTYLENINMLIPEPAAALAGGITVGSKQALGGKLKDDFRTTGIIHIVVLSGYNVVLIASFMERLFLIFPPWLGRIFASIGIVLFAIMTGGTATVVRSSAMGLLVILAKSTARTYAALRALFIVAFLMLLWNPKILVSDISFQLSFIATFALIVGMPLVEERLKGVPSVFQLKDLLTATVATYIGVLPLILYYMGDLSFVSIPVNLLVLPTIAPAMLTSFLTSVIAMFSITAALPFSYLSYLLLEYTLTVVDFFARFKLAAVHLPAFSFWWVVGAYVLLAAIVVSVLRNRPVDVR